MYPLDDTIAAVASPPGGAARGIVRISGPRARAVLQRCFRAKWEHEGLVVTRPAVIAGSLRLLETVAPLPCDLYLWPAGRSYTGDTVGELHTLGCAPLLDAVLHALCEAGARMAEPGEFTLRAFLAGRIDLTQAEAVLGVIDAADPAELEVALGQLAGGLSGPLQDLRNSLLDLLAHLEAGFDFADEHLPLIRPEELNRRLAEAAHIVAELAGQMASRGETAGTVRVVLVGAPNTGKSSLFNALARTTDALVSEQPGTTRDYLAVELDLDGVKCQLIDTAGAHVESGGPAAIPSCCRAPGDASHALQQAAEAVASRQGRRAHVQILCRDASRPSDDCRCEQLSESAGGERVAVLTKVDISSSAARRQQGLRTSSVTGQGIGALREELRRAVLAVGASGSGAVAGTAARCRDSLRRAADALNRARDISKSGGEDLVAAEIRVALDALGSVVGSVHSEDVLDRVFSRFCIGK